MVSASETVFHDIVVPASVLRAPETFGLSLPGGYRSGDLVLKVGRVAGMRPPSRKSAPRLVVPRLTEAHVHLDKCHSVDRMPDVGGDLRAAIDAQLRDKDCWTEEDLRARAARGIDELVAAGCRVVRSHVDWPGGEAARTAPLSWHVMCALAEERAGEILVQLSPLAGLDELATPGLGDAIAKFAAASGAALGCFVLDQPNRRAGIAAAFTLAQRYNVPLDFHVDEGLAPGLDGLLMIAEQAIATGFEGPVLCGHACSLMNLSGDPLARALEQIARAGLSVVALPTTNLYLQGRSPGTPDRRGITRLRELRDAGVPVIIGSDNVRDAFCPVGQHDPRAALSLAVLAAHLDPPLSELWPMITTDASTALGLSPVFVDDAALDDLAICDAASTSDCLSGNAPLRPLAGHLEKGLT